MAFVLHPFHMIRKVPRGHAAFNLCRHAIRGVDDEEDSEDLAEDETDVEELIGIYNDDQDSIDSKSYESIEQFVL